MTSTITTTQVSVSVSASAVFPYMTFYANGKRSRVQIFIGFDAGRDRAASIVTSIKSKYPTAELATWQDGSRVFTERYWNNTTKSLVRSDRKGFILNIPMQDMVVPSTTKPGFRKLDVLRAWVDATQKPRLVQELEANLSAPEPEPATQPVSDRRSELEAMAWSEVMKLGQSLGKPKSLKKKAEIIDWILENEF